MHSCGVKLWNKMKEDLKKCTDINDFMVVFISFFKGRGRVLNINMLVL